MSVYTVGKVISQTVQLDFGNIIQAKYFTVGQRFDDDIFELFRLLQTSFVTDGILESLVTAFTELSRGSFHVLFRQCCGYVTRNQLVLCHHVRTQPDTHGVVLSHYGGITHTRHTLNLRNQVDFCVVLDKCFCIRIGFIVKREYHQHGSLAFLGCHTDFGYFGRQ